MTHAEKVLEFDAVRCRLAAVCQTMLGRESAQVMRPRFEREGVAILLEETGEAYRLLGEGSPPSLGACHDLRDPWNRAQKGAVLGGEELHQTGEILAAFRAFRAFLSPRRADFPRLWACADFFPEQKGLEQKLLDSLDPAGEVRDGASPALASIRSRLRSAAAKVQEKIQSHVSGRSRDYLSDPLFTVRDGRYVLPVKADHRGKVAGVVHGSSASGQTVYVEPEDVLQAANKLRALEGEEQEEVLRVLAALSLLVGERANDLRNGLVAAGEADFVLARARLAYAQKASAPELTKFPGLKVEGGRHPLLEEAATGPVIPLDIEVGGEFRGLLITGPNTGGKTIALKTVGLFALMAQCGLYLPARAVWLGPFSQVWADIGDEQSIQQSLSTFSGHIKNIAEAISGLKPGALLLFDEIGAGTDPAEGAALAKAILVHLYENGAVIAASTHYGELKTFAFETQGFCNAAMEFDSKTLRPTYRLLMGAPGASHALRVAERFGLPKALIERARDLLDSGDRDLSRVLQELETAQRQARIAQGEADRRLTELRRTEERAARKLEEADEVRRTAHKKAEEALQEALRSIRSEAHQLFEELKEAKTDKERDALRTKLRALQDKGSDAAGQFQEEPERAVKAGADIQRGAAVKVEGYSQVGTALSAPKNGKVEVQLGPIKMSVAASKVQVVGDSAPVKRQTQTGGVQRAMNATTELHVRQMRAEDALDEIEKFLDSSVLAGVHQVRIIHGKGEGVLRQITRQAARKNTQVASFRDGDPGEGGNGATIVVFK